MKIRYATMIVDDMEESVKFYTETLDFTLDEVFDFDDDGQAKVIQSPIKEENEDTAKELIIMGFVSAFREELPMEYAVELNRLLALNIGDK